MITEFKVYSFTGYILITVFNFQLFALLYILHILLTPHSSPLNTKELVYNGGVKSMRTYTVRYTGFNSRISINKITSQFVICF